jgi:hypothetical protein
LGRQETGLLTSCPSAALQGLLRQGREATEQLLQLPITPPACSTSSSGAGASSQGQLIVRLINVGRAPAGAPAGSFDDAGAFRPASPGRRRVRVRAAPFEPGSPVAAELRGATGGGGSSGALADLRGRVSGQSPGPAADEPAAELVPQSCSP